MRDFTFKLRKVTESGSIVATIRFNDDCKNGHQSFAITGEVYEKGQREAVAGGCLHEDIATHFPELAPFIKWHLTSTDGPLHYLANSMYWAKQGDLKHAQSCAIWYEAKLEDFTKENLEARLPQLMRDFNQALIDVKSLRLQPRNGLTRTTS